MHDKCALQAQAMASIDAWRLCLHYHCNVIYLKLQIGKCKLKILFFQFSFFNYSTRSLRLNFLLSLRAPKTRSVEGAKQSVMFKRLLYRNDTCKHFLDSAPRACWISMHCQQCLTRLKFFYSVKNKKGLTEKKKNSVRLEEWL